MVTDRSGAVALALEMAATARSIILDYYRQGVAVEAKSDASPVTLADRGAEAAMRRLINQRFPDHGIFGEEYGVERGDAEHVWVLDPIDGTKSFISGNPLFGTLIALVENGRPVVGLIDMPVLDESWVGADDRPATLNGAQVRVRANAALDAATLYATSPDMFVEDDEVAYRRLARAVRYPMYGANCYAYSMVAKGTADLVCEAQLKPYDYCACAALIEAAGGFAVDWRGAPLGLGSGDKVLLGGDARLKEPALAALAGA